jgi:anaerobic ribonucleoside-triphosphate reductase activating protein
MVGPISTEIPGKIRISTWSNATTTEGPGTRYALWVQGCSLRCRGCTNPNMFDPRRGIESEVQEIVNSIESAQQESSIEGITLLGGEPFEQPSALAEIAQAAHQRGLSVMVFSGYTLEEIRSSNHLGVQRLLEATDLLVDGRFEQDLLSHTRRWIGSTNQRVHYLSARYAAHDMPEDSVQSIQIRMVGDQIEVTGWPELARKLVNIRPKSRGK